MSQLLDLPEASSISFPCSTQALPGRWRGTHCWVEASALAEFLPAPFPVQPSTKGMALLAHVAECAPRREPPCGSYLRPGPGN